MNNLDAEPNEINEKKQQKGSLFPYIVIVVLAIALLALGALTFVSLNKLASLQAKVLSLQDTVEEIASSASVMSQKANELESLEQQISSQTETNTLETQQSQEQPQEEGTLSPNQSESFTDNTDESMDNLLSQISTLLPQNNGTWSVYVCNLLKNTEGAIHEQPMQAASLIKLFIMGTVYENYDSITGQYTKESVDSLLHSMITVSDNDAANTLVTYLGQGNSDTGREKVNQFCQAHGYTSTTMGRMLLESAENGDNLTSVKDCGAFLKEIYQICNGTAQNASLSHAENMYYLLKLQERKNKIPAQMPDGVHVANKTGELTNVENDVGIIYDTAKGVDLVVCFMSQDVTDTAAAQSSIASCSRMIYGYYNE